MDVIFNDSSFSFENDVQYLKAFDSILKIINERDNELSNKKLLVIWDKVFTSEAILDKKIKNSVGFQELSNILKLEKDELTKAENELKILRERKNQQLNEFNSKRDEILYLISEVNNSTNYIPSSVTPQQVTEPQIKKYYKDLLRMRAILAKQQQLLNKFYVE